MIAVMLVDSSHAAPAEGPPPPTTLEARRLSGKAEHSAQAEGNVELRRGTLILRADRLDYDLASDRAVASGQVEIRRPGSVFRGPRLELQVERTEGFLLEPEFDLERSRAGGRAQRVDFMGAQRFVVAHPQYTSCPRDGSADPDWLLTATRLRVDLEANEAVAEGARLYFMGVPVMALPVMSFPATGERKSGWLPPRIRNDSRSGLQLAVPYYWNAAPERDVTLTPYRLARRGWGVDAEFRYLGLGGEGQLAADVLPDDALTGTRRHSLRLRHEGALPAWGPRQRPGWLELSALRVSDNDWWKDFPSAWLPLSVLENDWWGGARSSWMPLTPRLLPVQAQWVQPLSLGGMDLRAEARHTRWQRLQGAAEPLGQPYDRDTVTLSLPDSALMGLRTAVEVGLGAFSLPQGQASAARPTGQRWHLLGHVSRRWEGLGAWVQPTVSLNAAGYALDQVLPDGRTGMSRTIPSAGLDAGMAFERDLRGFGRALLQTFEPRLMLVKTPYREQSPYLLFDSAPKDFSLGSIFTFSDYSGIDRVPDAQHLNLGAVNRIVDAVTADELFRLEVVQRYQLGEQRIASEGPVLSGRSSDLLVLGSTRVIPRWALSSWLRWNAQTRRPVRSILSAVYAPDPQRQAAATYRFSRGLAEQLEAQWKWPLRLPGTATAATPGAPALACTRRWTTVGEAVYSAVERRLTRALAGVELDAGCWGTRLVLIRQASALTATTIVQFQVELKGLSSEGLRGPVRP